MGRLLEKLEFHFILFITPILFSFQMIILFPKLIKIVNAGPIQQYIHVCLAFFCLVNILGNMIISAATELNTMKEALSGDRFFCEYCKMWRSTDCLHCKKCNACIMRRDHHCGFLANCIGLYNRRYYILFLAYVAIAMFYATLYNYCLLIPKRSEDLGLMVHMARVINPAVWYLIPVPFGQKDVYMLYIILNAGLGSWAFYLFCYHMKNSALGVTAFENKFKPNMKNMKRWKENLLNVFGAKWYWAMVWPLSSSPLPNIKAE